MSDQGQSTSINRLFRHDKKAEYLSEKIASLASRIPELKDLTPEQVDAIATATVIDELKAEMHRALLAARVNWAEEAEAFIDEKNSRHTKIAYKRALDRFFAWLTRKNLSPLDLTPRLADDFIRSVRAEGKDTDTSRLYIAAASSFYTFLERRFDEVRNPFRGTKARPKATWKTAVIPSAEEITTIIETADPVLKVAVMVVAETGLRVGGLARMMIKADGTLVTISKGSQHIHPEPLSAMTRQAIHDARLDARHPFRDVEVNKRGQATTPNEERFTAALKTRLARHCARLAQEGKIRTVYSFHDFRHAFADMNSGRGLVWLRDRLGQSSIVTTEKYLKNVLKRDTRGM